MRGWKAPAKGGAAFARCGLAVPNVGQGWPVYRMLNPG